MHASDMPNMDGTTTEEASPSAPPAPCADRVAHDGTLTVFSKKSKRRLRKQQRKQAKSLDSSVTLLDLPFDILIQVLTLLRPSDNFRLARTCRALHACILDEHAPRIAARIVRWRYACLEKCLRLPVPVASIPEEYRRVLLDQELLSEVDMQRKRPYQHIRALNPEAVCRCLTCILRWNVLCLAVDFAHWQDELDGHGSREGLPVFPRGRQPQWNTRLLDAHASVVEKALGLSPGTDASCGNAVAAPLWHAAVLEAHLESTVRSIRRHRANTFNKRPHFAMTHQDALSGTDAFLQKKGPPSMDFPFSRDNYYMLEAYLPNRSWFREREEWGYMPEEQHDKDIEQMRKWAIWRRETLAKKGEGGGGGSGQNGHNAKGHTTWTMNFTGSDWKPTFMLGGEGGPHVHQNKDAGKAPSDVESVQQS